MKVEFDPEANAAYYKLKAGRIAKTERMKVRSVDVLVDYDKKGHVLGVEVLNMKMALTSSLGKMGLALIPEIQAKLRK
jgi:uncharacterized protein YuzE